MRISLRKHMQVSSVLQQCMVDDLLLVAIDTRRHDSHLKIVLGGKPFWGQCGKDPNFCWLPFGNSSEILTSWTQENGDCQEPDDRHSERSRVGSELLHSADDFPSEHSRVSSELHCYTFQGTVTSSQGGLSSFSDRYPCQSSIESFPLRLKNIRSSGAAVDWCSKQRLGGHSHDTEPTEALHQGQWCRIQQNKLLFLTVQQNLKSSHWTLD